MAVVKENNVLAQVAVKVIEIEAHVDGVGNVYPFISGNQALDVFVLDSGRQLKTHILFGNHRMHGPDAVYLGIPTQSQKLQAFTNQIIGGHIVGFQPGAETVDRYPPVPGNQGGVIDTVTHYPPDLEFRSPPVVVNVDRAAESVFTGKFGTEVVVVDTCIEPEGEDMGIFDVDRHINLSGLLSLFENDIGFCLGYLVGKHQALFKCRFLHNPYLFLGTEIAFNHPVAVGCVTRHFDLAQAALGNGDLQLPVCDFLLRQVGPGEDVALFLVYHGDLVGQFTHLLHGERLAHIVLDRRIQLFGTDDLVAFEDDALDQDTISIFFFDILLVGLLPIRRFNRRAIIGACRSRGYGSRSGGRCCLVTGFRNRLR